jgi:hypothetical protein
MKKWILVLSTTLALAACSNNGGEGGVVDDGIKASDPNGAREGSTRLPDSTDTTKNLGQPVDTEKRDSSGMN